MTATATTTNFFAGQRVAGVTPSGRRVREGEFLGLERDALSGDYMAVVRWDGDDYDSVLFFARLIAA